MGAGRAGKHTVGGTAGNGDITGEADPGGPFVESRQ
jgi:hypothetical protein